MNHENRNWQRRWKFFTETYTAVHETGIAVKFVTPQQYAGMPPAKLGGHGWAAGDSFITVCTNTDAELDEWARRMKEERGKNPRQVNQYEARLMREAGELYAREREGRRGKWAS
ncbi:MAG: hypothetical protein LBG69_04355 [Zoogloeaceae bacterium]|jgi:cephalosporin-C deacetylase-like acetyl esterase|nr:hypothetical protein [Zoogloeaceae bacterium]